MNRQTYEKIIEIINKNGTLNRSELFKLINEKIGQMNEHTYAQLRYETFTSIYGNLKRRQMFKSSSSSVLNWRRLKDNAVNFSNKYKEYESDESKRDKNLIIHMANEIGVSTVLMARLILDGFIRLGQLELNNDLLNNEQQKISISNLIKETHLLKNGRLAAEILECCAIDDDYGPSIDLIKNLIGIEYEIKLEHILVSKGITFVKEEELREKGFDKTPDFKLELPIYLSNGKCISWIDSKATCGDELAYNDYYESQFKYYLNRFGSGLVIFWFGFLSDLQNRQNFYLDNNSTNSTNHSSITLMDRFPSEFTMLDVNSLI